mgnify:CR=1 FL=1
MTSPGISRLLRFPLLCYPRENNPNSKNPPPADSPLCFRKGNMLNIHHSLQGILIKNDFLKDFLKGILNNHDFLKEFLKAT